MKSYHVTWDAAPELCEANGGAGHPPVSDIKAMIVTSQPYLFVREIGITGKIHFHGYFFSDKCKNTVKKKMQELFKVPVYFTDPENPKYLKYKRDGVLGVEIYLMKGEKNHMKPNDDLKVTPFKLLWNTEYYGVDDEPGTKLHHIRKIYKKTIEDMKNYKSTVAKITKERKETEWQLILKDINNYCLDTRSQIKDYLAFVHYKREKYNFTENSAKSLFRKIFKLKQEQNYLRYIRERMDEIII